nr:hypothetical protein [Flavobacterium sp.]
MSGGKTATTKIRKLGFLVFFKVAFGVFVKFEVIGLATLKK